MKKKAVIISSIIIFCLTAGFFLLRNFLYTRKSLELTFDGAYYYSQTESDYGKWHYEKTYAGHEYYLYLPEKYRNDIKNESAKIEKGKASSSLSAEKRHTLNLTAAALEEEAALIERNGRPTGAEAFALLKKDFDSRVAALKRNAEAAGKKLSNAFAFLEEVFGEGQELLILVTELTINAHSSRFISRYGCKEYFAHNKELLFYERRKELIEELGDLNFD